MSDEAYEPPTSNRAVENAAITFALALKKPTDGGLPTRVEHMHLLTSRATTG